MLYEVTLNKSKLNEYQIGKINGVIWALTGMNENTYPIWETADGTICKMRFDADKETMLKVEDAIDKLYPDVIIPDKD